MFSNMMDMLPDEALDDHELVRTEAIIQSMTPGERRNPELLDTSRMRRIARGCGRSEEDVRSLYERFLMARQFMGQFGQASGLFGGMRQTRRMRRQLAKRGADMGMTPMAGLMGLGDVPRQEDAGPQPTPEEKLARRRKQKSARKARRKNRKRR